MKIRNEKKSCNVKNYKEFFLKSAKTIFTMAMCIFLYDENNSRGDGIQAECKKKLECIPVGCVPSDTVAVCWRCGDVWPGGCGPGGGRLGCVWSAGCLPGGCLPRGSGCLGCLPPASTEFLTHVCENITFLQLHLRMVIMDKCLTALFTKPPASRFPAIP